MKTQQLNYSGMRELSIDEVMAVGGGYYTGREAGDGGEPSGVDRFIDGIVEGVIDIVTNVTSDELGDWLDTFGLPSNESVVHDQFNPGGESGNLWAQGSDGIYYIDRNGNGSFDMMYTTDASGNSWCSTDGKNWVKCYSGHDHGNPPA